MILLNSRSIYYDNVNLIAQPTEVKSRKEIPQELERIIVSPMQSIIGQIFANKALDLGLTVCLHRFDSTIQERLKLINDVFMNMKNPNSSVKRLWVSVGLKDLENIEAIVHQGVENIIIDVANGYMSEIIEFASQIFHKSNKQIKKIMLGNIHSSSILPDYQTLSNYFGIPIYFRCGIASGSVCNTKGMTGYNRGQITEIQECVEWIEENNSNLILVADGGIANPACAAKAFGAGAEYVMMGGYFAHAKEAQHVIDELYKFWGGASEFQQILSKGVAERHSEGKEKDIHPDHLESLDKLVYDLWGGISSAISYSGYTNLTKFIGNGIFEIKQ
jgi:mannose/fructose/N-acetylgalactosamine-specific phosphotransferase system component IIB